MRFGWLAKFRGYRPEWAARDVMSGLAIAAVGLPSAIAYPAIAGLPPAMGIYSSIIPLIAYALVGSSRRLIVGPDAGTTIVLAAVLASFGPAAAAAGDRATLTAAIAVIVGVLCFVMSLLRLGFVASFLSRPILLGFMCGTSVSILIGQIGRLTGLKIEAEGLVPPLVELASKFARVHWLTLALGLGLFVLLRVLSALRSRIPGPLVVVVLAIACSAAFDLQARGVAVVGAIPAGLPSLVAPIPRGVALSDLLLGAAAVLLVSFGAGIVTARSFAAKADEVVYANRELIGFGAANIGAGLFGGIPVTASDSRTAINFATGGKTQLAGIAAALALAGVVVGFTNVLGLLPIAALGAILASAAVGLIDLRGLADLWKVSRIEFIFALISMSGAIKFGVLRGVIIAVAASLAYVILKSLRPRDALLGRIPGREGFHKLHRHPEAKLLPNMTICLFQGNLLFFNVDYVRTRFEEIAADLPPGTRWLVLDASAVVQIDSTAAALLDEVRASLEAQGVAFGLAELHDEPHSLLDRSGVLARLAPGMIFEDLEDARLLAETTARAPAATLG